VRTSRFIHNDLAYRAGEPRVFLPFEDRRRNMEDLLRFGTVLTIFPSSVSWQLDGFVDARDFSEAVRNVFRVHQYNFARDFVVLAGDPLVIALTLAAAASIDLARQVTALKWDRHPCPQCRRYGGCEHGPGVGAYLRIPLSIP